MRKFKKRILLGGQKYIYFLGAAPFGQKFSLGNETAKTFLRLPGNTERGTYYINFTKIGFSQPKRVQNYPLKLNILRFVIRLAS
jgi:hypothetical protein